jgi:DNA-binding NarL/FixJ family response regulator
LLKEEFPSVQTFEACNSQQAIEMATNQSVDIILLDISMPGRNGIETLKQMKSMGIKAPILMLSMHPEDQYAIRSLKAGASGFINKETATEELLTAVHRILDGKKYITPSVAERLVDVGEQGTRAAHEFLSDREMQVLQKIGAGKTVSEIADDISLSVNTISTYRSRLLEKLGLNNNAELTRYAIDNDLI